MNSTRLLRLDEIPALGPDGIYFVEYRGSYVDGPLPARQAVRGSPAFHPDYGKHWRYWTERPTDEQRAMTPWVR